MPRTLGWYYDDPLWIHIYDVLAGHEIQDLLPTIIKMVNPPPPYRFKHVVIARDHYHWCCRCHKIFHASARFFQTCVFCRHAGAAEVGVLRRQQDQTLLRGAGELYPRLILIGAKERELTVNYP